MAACSDSIQNLHCVVHCRIPMYLSSDVSAAFDPNYPSVMDKKNAAYFGKGMVFNKYTGSRGKSGSNDASAEYVGKIARSDGRW